MDIRANAFEHKTIKESKNGNCNEFSPIRISFFETAHFHNPSGYQQPNTSQVRRSWESQDLSRLSIWDKVSLLFSHKISNKAFRFSFGDPIEICVWYHRFFPTRRAFFEKSNGNPDRFNILYRRRAFILLCPSSPFAWLLSQLFYSFVSVLAQVWRGKGTPLWRENARSLEFPLIEQLKMSLPLRTQIEFFAFENRYFLFGGRLGCLAFPYRQSGPI